MIHATMVGRDKFPLELFRQALRINPDIQVLYTSGDQRILSRRPVGDVGVDALGHKDHKKEVTG
jgi:hypothetical protein